MPEILPPRDYQEEAITAAFDARSRGVRCFSSVLATGLGKTVIFSHIAKRVGAEKIRSMILVHRDELVKQTVKKIHTIAPHLTVGVVKAERREWFADVVVASVQTIGRNDGKAISAVPNDHFGWITIDECHHAAADSYQNVIRYFPGATVAGYTATLGRADKLGLGDTFTENVFIRDIMFGIRNGHLVPPRAYSVQLDIGKGDLKGGKDYTDSSASDALIEADAVNVYVRVIRDRVNDRQGVVFMPSVETGKALVEALNAAGFPAEGVFETTTSEERDLIFKRVTVGETQILVNCMVLTEGFDLPQISFVIPRPTKNAGLFAQMVGRGIRPSDNHDAHSPYPWRREPKTDCVVLCPQGGEGVKLATIADLSPTFEGIEVDDEDTLIDIEEKRRKRDKDSGPVDLDKIKVTEIDLFAASKSAWLRTKKGYWFIPLKDWSLVIYPEDQAFSSFMLGIMYTGSGIGRKGQKYGEDMNLEYAKAWGESVAQERDPSGTYSTKNASWKKKKSAPTEAQCNFAKRLGIDPKGKNKTELSDLISIEVSSRVLDRYDPPAQKASNAA